MTLLPSEGFNGNIWHIRGNLSVALAFVLIENMTVTSQSNAWKYGNIYKKPLSQHWYSCVSGLASHVLLYGNKTSPHFLSAVSAVSRHLHSHPWLYKNEASSNLLFVFV